MKPISQVTAMVVSNGLDVSLAAKLAEKYQRVYFHVPQDDEFPRLNDAWIGRGMGKIEVLDDMWGPAFDEVDLFIFPDLGFPWLQQRLEQMGKIVWGSRNGEELEQDRLATRKLLKKLGLPVGKYTVLKGFDALRAFLERNKSVFVKVSRYRGSWETIFSEDYDLVKPELDERELSLSGISEEIEFICEEKIEDAVELATDGWIIDGQSPQTGTLVGVEQKDSCYAGRWTEWGKVPKPLASLIDAIRPTLKQYGYRNFFSPETLIAGDKAFLNDPCCRIPSPPGSLYIEYFMNLAEIIWAGAQGEIIEPKPIAAVGAELVLSAPWGDKHWNMITWPAKYDRNVKLREACLVGGKYRSVPQGIGLTSPGSVIGWGETLDQAVAMIAGASEALKATNLKAPLDAFDDLRETLDKAKSLGLTI